MPLIVKNLLDRLKTAAEVVYQINVSWFVRGTFKDELGIPLMHEKVLELAISCYKK